MDFIDLIGMECAGRLMEMDPAKVTRKVFHRVTYQGAGQAGIRHHELHAVRNATLGHLPPNIKVRITKGSAS